MDKKYIKRFIEECPLNNFTDDGNATERHKQLDEYLNRATEYINVNEEELARAFLGRKLCKKSDSNFANFTVLTPLSCFS